MAYDFTRISDVMDAMYASLSGPAGDRDWGLRDEIFHPQARLVRTGADENGVSWLKVMTAPEYRDNVSFFFSKVPFYEVETERRVEQFGNIAHVWSVYADSRDPRADTVERRGINSVQLFRDSDGRWRILSITWDNEREGVTLPE